MKLYTTYSVTRYNVNDGWCVVGNEFGTKFIYDRYKTCESAYKMAKALNWGQEPTVRDFCENKN